jgi:hypothetical protein
MGAALARIGERRSERDLHDARTITRAVPCDAEIERFSFKRHDAFGKRINYRRLDPGAPLGTIAFTTLSRGWQTSCRVAASRGARMNGG